MKHVLLIDDDEMILKAVEASFKMENIKVVKCTKGFEGLEIIKNRKFDAIILDIMMPDINGFDLIQKIRNLNIYTPIIIISGKDEDHNKILGLGVGADDYVTKPFSIHLLISKVKALIRRTRDYSGTGENALTAGPFFFNKDKMQVYKNGVLLDLTSKEMMLLKFFMENSNKVFTKEQLYRQIWNETAVDDNTIMVYIKRLRNKIEDNPKEPQYLKTVWGIGYIFNN